MSTLQQLAVPWWNSNWSYAQTITIGVGPNTPLNGYNGYSVRLLVDTTDPTRFQAGCDDLRIVYWNGIANLEIDRDTYNCGAATTEVWFALQADIAANSSDSNYFLYYGNPSAGSPPADRSLVYIWWDDFSSDPFTGGTARYTRAKAVDIHGSGYSSPTYDAGNQRVQFNTGDNFTSDMYIDHPLLSNGEQDVFIQVDHYADLSYPSNATDTIVSRVSGINTSSSHEYLHFSHGSYPESPGCTVDSWLNGERNTVCGGIAPPVYWSFNLTETWAWTTFGTSHRFWRDIGAIYVSPNPASRTQVLTGVLSSPQPGYIGLAPAQSRGWWDNLLVRRYIEPEPTITLGPEESYGPPVIVDPKVDSLFADIDGNGVPSPGDILGYSISISNSGLTHALSVSLYDLPDLNTTLIVGSVTTTQGFITRGNNAGDADILIDIGTIPPGGSVLVTFRVEISSPLPAGVDSIANQGIVSGSNFSAQPTNDPATSTLNDPTVTLLERLSTELPATGFAPDLRTQMAEQPQSFAYHRMEAVHLEIPRLDLNTPIIGVPLGSDGWDVTWLGTKAGYLEGTAYPSWPGNTALTAHVYLASGNPGPFVNLHTLNYGERVILHIGGMRYIYEVRSNERILPNDLSVIQHETFDWLTLVTCRGFSEADNAYRWRQAVRAVLVRVEVE